MSDIMDMMDCLKTKAKESMKYYSEKDDWKPEDLKFAKEAVELYDKVCETKMNDGIWEGMKGGIMDENSGARYPRISYGYGDSFARGRDAATGRYVSRGGEDMWYDNRSFNNGSYGNQNYGGHSGYQSYGGNMNRSMGYNDNTSGHSIEDRMIWALEQQMDTAKSDYERQQIKEEIDNIRRKNKMN